MCFGLNADSDFLNVAATCLQKFRVARVHGSVEQTAIEGTTFANETFFLNVRSPR